MAKRGIFKAYEIKKNGHDPILDAVDRVYELAGLLKANGMPRYEKIAELSGDIRAGTLYNWRVRKTKRPQSAKVEGVLRGCGAERVVIFRGQIIHYGRTRPRVHLATSGGKRVANG